MNIKQVIVLRKDLNMRKGKMCAQAAHASMMFLINRSRINDLLEHMWINNGMKKICVSVNSETELLDIFQKAKDANLIVHLVTDAGLTEFDGPTKTCLAIGPNVDTMIDPITRELALL